MKKTCNRKHCHRPRWRDHVICRYHVLHARAYERLRRKRVLMSPRRGVYLAKKNISNRVYQRWLRDALNPDRRLVRCGLCEDLGHNRRTCPRSKKIALDTLLATL